MRKPASLIGSIVFGIVALAHLVRLFLHIPIVIGTFEAPGWVSVPVILAAGALSLGLWRERRGNPG